ncbi:MAG: shikimate kinase [Bacteroidaceae bacterium]|jgi:shikimate kinase|nr:shikimate kinase [Bacteroidaceae bacterium]
MTRILLIGFMAAGKTTLGKALARDLGLQFIDLDHYIENRYHSTVSQLFADRGEEGFRQIERNMLHEVTEFEDVIIATGGGTPCFYDNMEYMNSKGITVFLQASVDVIYTRLTIARVQRPLVKGKTADELRQYIADMLEMRSPYYTRAHHTFCADYLENTQQVSDSVQRFKSELL